MKNLFLVVYSSENENGEILGIYTSVDLAEKRVNEVAQEFDYELDELHILEIEPNEDQSISI